MRPPATSREPFSPPIHWIGAEGTGGPPRLTEFLPPARRFLLLFCPTLRNAPPSATSPPASGRSYPDLRPPKPPRRIGSSALLILPLGRTRSISVGATRDTGDLKVKIEW